jgi:gas vesicle protein
MDKLDEFKDEVKENLDQIKDEVKEGFDEMKDSYDDRKKNADRKSQKKS